MAPTRPCEGRAQPPQGATLDGGGLRRAALDALAQVLTVENVNAWLATTRALDQEGEVPRVAVPAAFNQTWLEHKLAGKVMAALHKLDDDALASERVGRVEYIVDPAACVPTEATARAS